MTKVSRAASDVALLEPDPEGSAQQDRAEQTSLYLSLAGKRATAQQPAGALIQPNATLPPIHSRATSL